MSGGTVHRLVGYHRKTEQLSAEYDIPAALLPVIKRIADVSQDDPDALGSYPLDGDQARNIAERIGVRVDPSKLDYFLEPFAEPRRPGREKHPDTDVA